MSLFPWMLVFCGLAVLALGLFALIGLRLWRKVRSLGRDLSAATEHFAEIGQFGP